jgi:peptide/nickel transport system substrate-binding protein
MGKFKFPKKRELNAVFSSFSKKERNIFAGLLMVLLISTVLILNNINEHFMVSVPTKGGEISEGIVGSPRFINPVLAFSDSDRDMVSLVYSGLMRKNGDGTLSPDLAQNYEVSKDNLEYTFTLKNDITFHDGRPLTTDDIFFTISTVKNSVVKSALKSAWEGVTVEKVDDKTIKFRLRQPYTGFLENTVLGIMPAHIWNNSPIELNAANTEPIGSGPYMIKMVNKETSGVIRSYELLRFENFVLGTPYIKTIYVRFYQNEEDLVRALKGGEVTQISSIDPVNALVLKKDGYNIKSSTLPRVFGLFFNQSQNQLFINKTVVRAIDQAIDKDRIINEVLSGYGTAINDPIPPTVTTSPELSQRSAVSRAEVIKNVEAALAKDGWKKNANGILEKTTTVKGKKSTTPLQFSISTSNAPELARAAELIREDLQKIGMQVDVKTFEVGNLNQSVIRARNYDALLFGQIINHESDLYAFWHSSQRRDPGLNVAMYTNAKVDKILEDAFVTVDEATRAKKYTEFENEVRKDMPAVFLYSPNFIYVVSKNLKGLVMEKLAFPSDRFSNVHLWYTETDDVWKIFSKAN